jgi:hypothetical protein
VAEPQPRRQQQQQLAEQPQQLQQLVVWHQQPLLQERLLRVARLLLRPLQQLQLAVQLSQLKQLPAVQLQPQLPPQLPHLPAVQLQPASLQQPLQHPVLVTKTRDLYFLFVIIFNYCYMHLRTFQNIAGPYVSVRHKY